MAGPGFPKGHKLAKGGKRLMGGRKPTEVQQYRDLLHKEMPEVIAGMRELCKSKNLHVRFQALQWWADHVVGKAAATVKLEASAVIITDLADCDQAILAEIRRLGTKPEIVADVPAIASKR